MASVAMVRASAMMQFCGWVRGGGRSGARSASVSGVEMCVRGVVGVPVVRPDLNVDVVVMVWDGVLVLGL